MPDAFIGEDLEQVEGEAGRPPRGFVWRGRKFSVAEVMLTRHVYGTGREAEAAVWMPRVRQTYYCVRTAEGPMLELCAEKHGEVEAWSLYAELAEAPAEPAVDERAERGTVGVGQPKPRLSPPYRLMPYGPSQEAWRDFLLRECEEQPAGVLGRGEPKAAYVAEYGRLIAGLVEVGEPLLGGGAGVGEVRGLWVLPAFRRLGIGTMLLRKAEGWARGEKLKRL